MPGNGAQPQESPTSFGAAQKFRSAQVCSEASAPSSHHPITPHSPPHMQTPPPRALVTVGTEPVTAWRGHVSALEGTTGPTAT